MISARPTRASTSTHTKHTQTPARAFPRRLLAGALCAALAGAALAALGQVVGPGLARTSAAPADAAPVSNHEWGLSFQQEKAPPVPNLSAEALRPYNAYYCAATGQKRLYLTFDAGYENGNTAPILDALQKHNAPAAFFVVGSYVKENPDLVRRMVAEGHTVGNHTYHHPDMSQKDKAAFTAELTELAALFEETTGQSLAPFYRPPEGKFSTVNLQWAQELGYQTVFWSLAYVDWNTDAQPTHEKAFEKLLPRTHDGAIVLLHSTSATNAEILDELLTRWENEGYTFGSLDEILPQLPAADSAAEAAAAVDAVCLLPTCPCQTAQAAQATQAAPTSAAGAIFSALTQAGQQLVSRLGGAAGAGQSLPLGQSAAPVESTSSAATDTTPYPLQTAPPYTVAIDAGHGGFDTGANALLDELEVCNATAEALLALLEQDPNYTPVRTRPADEDRTVPQRAQAAIDAEASLLLSIHANCDKSAPGAKGFECYPTPPGRLYAQQSMRFAQCLAQQMQAAGHRLRAGNGIRFAYYYGKEKRMVDSTADTTVHTQKSFGIVERPLCPAVLVEQCFLTNAEDTAAWATPTGCAKAARAYYNAICTYFGTVPTA